MRRLDATAGDAAMHERGLMYDLPLRGGRTVSLLRRVLGALVVCLLASSALLLEGCTGIGLAAGTAVDSTMNLVAWPIREGVCAGAYKYDNNPDLPWHDLENTSRREYGEELVAVAVSGGGSRAAYFLACALDEMRKVSARGPGPVTGSARSLLDEVDFISSVSGGSLSSAYYVTKRPRKSDKETLDAFFAQYKIDMRKNFELRTLGRIFFMFRWIPLLATYYNRGHLISGTWDSQFFDDMNFADIPQPGGAIPSLLINAASYSTANKFVYSRIPTRWLNESKVFKGLHGSTLLNGSKSQLFTAFMASGFDRLNSDIGEFKLSYAVAASASVPGLLGPMTLRDATEEDGYETLGDGGLYDNYGVETALQAITRVLDDHPGRKARLIVIDGSGFYFPHRDFSKLGIADYLDRTNSVASLRSAGFAEVIYKIVPVFDPDWRSRAAKNPFDAKMSPYRNLSIEIVTMYQPDSVTNESDRQPGAYSAKDLLTGRALLNVVTDFNTRVRGIGTRFKIDSDDADVLEQQARIAVQQVLGKPAAAAGVLPVSQIPGAAAPKRPAPPAQPKEGKK